MYRCDVTEKRIIYYTWFVLHHIIYNYNMFRTQGTTI